MLSEGPGGDDFSPRRPDVGVSAKLREELVLGHAPLYELLDAAAEKKCAHRRIDVLAVNKLARDMSDAPGADCRAGRLNRRRLEPS